MSGAVVACLASSFSTAASTEAVRTVETFLPTATLLAPDAGLEGPLGFFFFFFFFLITDSSMSDLLPGGGVSRSTTSTLSLLILPSSPNAVSSS